MRTFKVIITIIVLFLSTFSCQSQNAERQNRMPAVSGTFYPASKSELTSMLEDLFKKAKPKQSENIVAILAPHAGYVYSGEVAASSFNQIAAEKEYENIFIIGSSHRTYFEGASIYNKGNYVTPLGEIKVNTELANKLINSHKLFVYNTEAHLNEHSIETQLPFLQYKMKADFRIVPIIIGSQTAEMSKKIAKALQPYFNEKNLFVFSTDFSHYPDYKTANKLDEVTANAVVSNSSANLIETLRNNAKQGVGNLSTSMCGQTSVLTLLYMTEEMDDIEFTKIQYKNSGDTDFGDKSRVVGYHSIAVSFIDKNEFFLTETEKITLLKIARETIIGYIDKNTIPKIDESKLTENLKVNCGAFVTLNKNKYLRGCIGRFYADAPLYKVVQDMAIAAATQDSRFPTVKSKEIKNLEIEISVLTPMKKIDSIEKIELGKHGIYIKKGHKGGTFLPQVATDTGWNLEQFLGHCARDKAGIGWEGWKDADIFIYQAGVFGEEELLHK